MKRLKVIEAEFEKCIVYKVESRTNPEFPHRVDISDHKGFGSCSCKNWWCKVWPLVKDKKVSRFSEKARCAHLEAVFVYIFRRSHKSLIDQFAPHESYDDET